MNSPWPPTKRRCHCCSRMQFTSNIKRCCEHVAAVNELLVQHAKSNGGSSDLNVVDWLSPPCEHHLAAPKRLTAANVALAPPCEQRLAAAGTSRRLKYVQPEGSCKCRMNWLTRHGSAVFVWAARFQPSDSSCMAAVHLAWYSWIALRHRIPNRALILSRIS